MKTITPQPYNVYTIDELSKEAQEKALAKHTEQNDYYFLSDYLDERLHELLEENKIKDLNDTSKPNTKTTQVYYSLSYSQGDGCMFEGNFEWKGYNIKIKQVGHYYHSNSKDITITDDEDNDIDGQVFEDFEAIYQEICKQLEKAGYDFMKYEDSMEAFKESCEANEYTFTKDGIMGNN